MRGDEAAVDDVAAVGREGVVGRRVPLDDDVAGLRQRAAVAERAPDVRDVRLHVLPGPSLARLGLAHTGGRMPSAPATRGPGTPPKRNGSGSRPGLHDPRLAGLAARERTRDRLGHVRGLEQREAGRLEPRLAVADQRRVDDPGAHGVDPYAARLERRRDAADEPDQEVLRRRVDRVGGHRRETGERGGHHDVAAAALDDRDERAQAEHDAVDVDAHDAAVRIVGDVVDVALVRHDARVEAGDVERLDRAGEALPLGRVADVRRRGAPVDRARDALRGDLVDVDDDQVGAVRGEPLGDRVADAGAAAGDERERHGTSTTLPTWRRSSIS